MDNSKDKSKHNTNSAGESRQPHPDPIVQARDDCSGPHKAVQPAEIMPAIKTMPPAGPTLLPNQFLRTAGPAHAGPSASDIAKSMLRYKWMIMVIFILVAAPAIATIWTQVIPQYRAIAAVRIQPIIRYLVFKTEESGMIPLYESFVNTQVNIMTSSEVRQRVLDETEVKETQWWKNPRRSVMERLGRTPPSRLERLADALAVKPRRQTEIVDISFLASSAKDAKIIADAVLDQYLKYTLERSDKTVDDIFRELADQYNTLRLQIQAQEQRCATLCESLGTQDPKELISSKRARLDQTQARLGDLQLRIAVLEGDRKVLEDFMKQDIAEDGNDVAVASMGSVEKQPKHYEDAEWRRLDANVRTIRHNIDTSPLKSKHPGWDRMAEELAYAEESLRLRETQLNEQWRDRPKDAAGVPITIAGTSGPSNEETLISLEQQLDRATREKTLVLAEFETQKTKFDLLFKAAQELERENNVLLQKQELFSAVRQRRDEKNMERNIPTGSIDKLTPAFASSRPYNDRRAVFTAMVLVMGLGLGGGAAFLRASRNQAICAPRDLPPILQAPFLGYIPLTRIKRPLGKSLHDEIQRIRDYKIESVRLVRTALLSRLNGQGGATILIASAAAGTGKSTFTMMLGKSLAQSGKKVIMVDADLRRMTLSKRFGLAGEPGFMESLRSKSVDRRQIFSTETSGLSILSAGRPNGDGSVFEETANGAFKACIAQLRRHFDIILLDSSPILAVADATILSGQVDGTILVERELVSQRPSVIDALARLDSAGGRLMGTVFVGSSESGSYGYGYGYSKTRYS